MKRGHSEDHEEESQSKRQRTSPGKKSPEVARDSAVADGLQDAPATTITEDKAQAAGATQRKPSVVDEKQRSKRLFGALLRNLRQPGDRTSKRRQEIETRRKAELQRQDDERLEDRQRRKKKLVEHRVVIQDEVDERTVCATLPHAYRGSTHRFRCENDTGRCWTGRTFCRPRQSRSW